MPGDERPPACTTHFQAGQKVHLRGGGAKVRLQRVHYLGAAALQVQHGRAQKSGTHHEAHEQGGKHSEEHREIHHARALVECVELLVVALRFGRLRLTLQKQAAPVDDAREAATQHIHQARNSGQQKNRRHGKLDGVGDGQQMRFHGSLGLGLL